jgi:hypothetical protein
MTHFEFIAGEREDSAGGSVSSDELSPKRIRKSSSRSSSPHGYKTQNQNPKRTRGDDNIKVFMIFIFFLNEPK